jgi:hypothetical protein
MGQVKILENFAMGRDVFECRKCGQCCEGRGGIVVGPKDASRLAAWLGLSVKSMAEKYCEMSRGKLVLTIGSDGFCIFFRAGQGCGVHPAKPDICRAWPFFRGNLEDPESYAMARSYCPGICRESSHEEFVREGRAYLRDNGLLADDAAKEANSLIVR